MGHEDESVATTDRGDGAGADLLLWSSACEGDAQARDRLAQLVAEVSRMHSGRLRLPRSEAEELESRLQASVWELMEVGRSTPRTSLRGWLRFRFLAVAKQYFRDIGRVRSLAPLIQDGEESAAAPLEDPPEAMQRLELRDALQNCLGELPGSQRDAVLRRYGDGSWEREMGPHESANPNTVRVWVFRGLIALRECLESRGVVA